MILKHPLMLQRVAAFKSKLTFFQKQVFSVAKREDLSFTQRQLALAAIEEARAAVEE
jgi:hypothetical protein